MIGRNKSRNLIHNKLPIEYPNIFVKTSSEYIYCFWIEYFVAK